MESSTPNTPRLGEFFILEAGAIHGPSCGVVFENPSKLLSPPRLILRPARKGPVSQDHHAIEQQTLERSPLLKAIAEVGHFDIHAPENRIFLPADPAFAQTLGITPHSGGPRPMEKGNTPTP